MKITLPLALSVVCGVISIDESSKGSSDESPDESSISSPDDSKNYMSSDEKFEWFILERIKYGTSYFKELATISYPIRHNLASFQSRLPNSIQIHPLIIRSPVSRILYL